jgi:hypothetical protein
LTCRHTGGKRFRSLTAEPDQLAATVMEATAWGWLAAPASAVRRVGAGRKDRQPMQPPEVEIANTVRSGDKRPTL